MSGEGRDHRAITDLLIRYCYCCDRNDPYGLADCFSEDCETDYGPGAEVRRGRAARREDASRDLALFEATFHQLSNVLIEFEGSRSARTQSTVQAWHRTKAPGPDWVLRGQYHDLVKLTDDGWLIARRRLVVIDAENFPADWDFHQLCRVS